MKLIQIKQAMRKLSLGQLRKLDEWLPELIQQAEKSDQAKQTLARKQIVEEQILENKTYRLQGIRCGKEKCKCTDGKLHGPYWYSYSRFKDKLRSQYIGKELPPDVQRKIQKRK